MKTALFIFGTRPEGIKLAPLIIKFKESERYRVVTCNTGQHQEMLDQVLDFFEIECDFRLNLMTKNQNVLGLLARAIHALDEVIKTVSPDILFVQGDTTTVLAGALAGFHNKVLIAHVEAGLRSHDKFSPFPEEMNRQLVASMADFNFTPSELSKKNLLLERVKGKVYNVGNTVIDALHLGLSKPDSTLGQNYFKNIDFTKKIILVTCHRRESFGEPFKEICNALIDISNEFRDYQIIYPVHLNPNIKNVANELLISPNIILLDPLDYKELIHLMKRSELILTDSGGIQEEAPSLGVPVLVLRTVTERTEAIDAGTSKLVGTDRVNIVINVKELLMNEELYKKMSSAINPYGTGDTSDKILKIIDECLQ